MLLPAPKNAPLVADFRLLGVLGHQIGAMLENARLYERAQSLAVLEERDRIAREMHDSLAQVLGFLKMKASLAGQRLRGGESDRAAQEVDEMAALAEEAYVDVREAILGLRDSIIPGIGLMGTLAEYLRKFSRQSGVCIRLEHPDGMNPRLSPMVEVQLVRVVQEALTNVRKHARARNATLRFKADDGWVDVTIQDDGKGFEVSGMDGSDGRHFGIEMMRERVGSVGGRFAIESAPHRGTTVGFRLPLNGNAKEAYL